MNAGLILAGGSGTRLLSGDRPKQFLEVGGLPLIEYSLQAFAACDGIGKVCVVVGQEWREELASYVLAEPGVSRQHSIYNGLLALKEYCPALVVVHDAARPLVRPDDIAAVLAAAAGYDGATPALAVTDTTYQSFDGQTIAATLNRDELFAGQTPECYRYSRYLAIHEQMGEAELGAVRGSSEIAVKAGLRIALCPGRAENFKVTTNADLERFREIIEKRQGL
jgi:2-C-methyl-D-erythritol 4-phosphate cytidylyltransferase